MKRQKTPAPRRAGTETKKAGRAAREAAVMADLDWLAANDLPGLFEAMQILARLTVSMRSAER